MGCNNSKEVEDPVPDLEAERKAREAREADALKAKAQQNEEKKTAEEAAALENERKRIAAEEEEKEAEKLRIKERLRLAEEAKEEKRKEDLAKLKEKQRLEQIEAERIEELARIERETASVCECCFELILDDFLPDQMTPIASGM
jgi:TusA-related sulfurtransferase